MENFISYKLNKLGFAPIESISIHSAAKEVYIISNLNKTIKLYINYKDDKEESFLMSLFTNETNALKYVKDFSSPFYNTLDTIYKITFFLQSEFDSNIKTEQPKAVLNQLTEYNKNQNEMQFKFKVIDYISRRRSVIKSLRIKYKIPISYFNKIYTARLPLIQSTLKIERTSKFMTTTIQYGKYKDIIDNEYLSMNDADIQLTVINELKEFFKTRIEDVTKEITKRNKILLDLNNMSNIVNKIGV